MSSGRLPVPSLIIRLMITIFFLGSRSLFFVCVFLPSFFPLNLSQFCMNYVVGCANSV